MGPGETFSLLGVLAVVIVFISLAFRAYDQRLKFKQRQLELRAGTPAPGASSEAIAQIEQRLRVLERIATERGQDVAAQIEALREQRDEAAGMGVPLTIEHKEHA